jgi:NAD(P)-dependent dehydrogenase (short-subunit alcohol dehydrogenase family)
MEIAGKVAVVTGAASGIGRATALALAREGASVVVADLDEAGGQETVGLIADEGGTALYVRCDVSEARSIEALFARAVEEFGGLDIVHNNAGIVCGWPLWPDITPEQLNRIIAVNLGGPILGTRLALDHLRARGGGVIVNTASLAAQYPLAEDPAYSATKSGVAMFTRACASLAAENIRVNAVLPGLVDTPLLGKTGRDGERAEWAVRAEPLTGMLDPADIAAAVVDLVRDDTAVAQERVVLGKPMEGVGGA